MENFSTHEAVKALLAADDKGREDFVEEVVKQLQRSRDTDISRLATKQDLQMLQLELTKKIDDDHAILQKNIDKLDAKVDRTTSEVRADMKDLRTEMYEIKGSLIQWMVGLQFAMLAVMIGLKLFG